MTEQPTSRLTEGQHGFAWGPVGVTRRAEINGTVVLGITTDAGVDLDVYVSPTGRSVRVRTRDKRVRLEQVEATTGGAA